MSAGGLGQRLSVFVAFTALAGLALAGFVAAPPAAAPTNADLAALETRMTATARLHPAVPLPAPPGPASWCAGCHPGLPHPGTGVERAMLNAHAGRLDCLFCHWTAAGGPRPVPVWRERGGSSSFLEVLPRDRITAEQLGALRAAAMAGRRCFERGPGCTGCHRPGGMGVPARPGAAPGHGAALEHLENHLTLAPGEKWYFPRFP
jgi:hypothetical protein